VHRAQQKAPGSLEMDDTLGLIYLKKNLTDEGLRIFKEIVIKQPDNPTFRLHLAMALFQKGNKPLAKKELQSALANKPSPTEQDQIKALMAKIG
jgi:predicted Zn-dependent protease